MATDANGVAGDGVEICRDRYGVPHIFGADVYGAYLGLGWCAAQDAPHGLPLHQLMLKGEMTATFGDVPLPDPRFPFLDVMAGTTFFHADGGKALRVDSLIDVDRWVKQFGYWDNAVAELPTLKPRTQRVLAAFAEGVNRFYDAHAPGQHEPYEAATEIAWWAFHEHSLTIGLFGLSNAFAIAPERSADGVARIGGDPHYWVHHRAEAHLSSPELELNGIWDGHVNVGAMGGSATTRHISMQGTAAALEAPTFYRERVNPENREQYWDHRAGGWSPFTVTRHEIKLPDGGVRAVFSRATHHGPVIAELLEQGEPVAFTLSTPFDRDNGRALEEFLELWLNESVADALAYLRDTEHSRAHRVLIDREGNLGFATLGPAPVRSDEVDWATILDGTDPRNEWGEDKWRPGDDRYPLPAYMNPASGFVQSANDASWFSTTPSPATRSEYPSYLFRAGWDVLGTRGARQRELLAGERRLSREDAMRVIFDVFVPQAFHGIAAYRAALAAAPQELSADAAQLDAALAAWDGMATVASPEMTIAFWLDRCLEGGIPVPQVVLEDDPSQRSELRPPLLGEDAAAQYAAALEAAAAELRARYGRLSVPWGEMHVFRVPDGVVGVPGGCNSLRALLGAWEGAWDQPDIVDEAGITHVNFGSHVLRLAEFGPDGPIVHSCLLSGQLAVSEHPSSPHASDQAPLYARNELKRLPLTRAEVLAQCDDADHADCNHDARTTLAAPTPLALGGEPAR